MRLALIGASGMVGSRIAAEALRRGHTVTAIVRDPARFSLEHAGVTVVVGDALKSTGVAAQIVGHDAVIGAISGRRDGDAQQIVLAAHALIAAAEQAKVRRVFWVGGAGSLEVAPGVRLVDTPGFPDLYKAEALAQTAALDAFRANQTLEWTYLSPPALLAPGVRTGNYQIGSDQLLSNAAGESTISAEDYAVAVVDELERQQHVRARFTVVG